MTDTAAISRAEFRQFDYGSAAYRQALALREEVLRRPLGRVLTPADTEGEQQQMHFGLFLEKRLVAGVIIKPTSSAVVTLRQMAVATQFQNLGLGGLLVENTEQALHQQGVLTIELAARQTAQTFYSRLGYHRSGEVLQLLDIPHVRMKKQLN